MQWKWNDAMRWDVIMRSDCWKMKICTKIEMCRWHGWCGVVRVEKEWSWIISMHYLLRTVQVQVCLLLIWRKNAVTNRERDRRRLMRMFVVMSEWLTSHMGSFILAPETTRSQAVSKCPHVHTCEWCNLLSCFFLPSRFNYGAGSSIGNENGCG